MPKQAIYKNSFSVLEDLEDTGMDQNEWQTEKEHLWGAYMGENRKRICYDRLGTQQQWSTRPRATGNRTHQAARNYERTMGTMRKIGNATSETNAFQNLQRRSNTNPYRKPTLCVVGTL